MAELVAKLSERLEQKPAQEKAAVGKPKGAPGPNRDRLTVGVDLGDRWSNYCILGLEGETLAEGKLRTTREDVAAFFRALAAARVVIEVGTHSAWVRKVVMGCGHEVLAANPRLMGRSIASARMTGSMPTSWRGWDEWIRSRCFRWSIGVGKCDKTWWCCGRGMRWCRCGRN